MGVTGENEGEALTCVRAGKALVGTEVVDAPCVNIRDGRIHSVTADPEDTSVVLDFGTKAVLFPGCVNTHAHSFQSLLRGHTNDCDLPRFLEVVYNAADAYGPADVYRGARLAFDEMIRHGITTVCDFFYLNGRGNANCHQVVRAARDAGVRLNLARAIIDSNPRAVVHEDLATGLARYHALVEAYRDDPAVTISLAPHSVYYSSPEVIAACQAQAKREGKRWYMHFADSRATRDYARERFGSTETQWLAEQGFLDERFVGIHGIWVTETDLALLAGARAAISHNPRSNQFLGEPPMQLPEMLARGIEVGLGTDGAASNPSLDLFQELRAAVLIQRAAHQDPTILAKETGLALATTAGANLTGVETGSLRPGQWADFLACDSRHPTLQPPDRLLSHYVYAMSPGAIRAVVVGGVLRWQRCDDDWANQRKIGAR